MIGLAICSADLLIGVRWRLDAIIAERKLGATKRGSALIARGHSSLLVKRVEVLSAKGKGTFGAGLLNSTA